LAPALIFDFDAADWLAHGEGEEVSAKDVKALLHAATKSEVDAALAEHLAEVERVLMQTLGKKPTVLVCSGYGYHAYYWFEEANIPELAATQALNKELVRRMNKLSGYSVADPKVDNPGERILRPPGSMNRKGDTPRLVSVVYSDTGRRVVENELSVSGALQNPALFQGIARASTKRPPELIGGDTEVTDLSTTRSIENWYEDKSVKSGAHWNICCPIADSKTPGSAFLVKEEYGVRLTCNAEHHNHSNSDDSGHSRWVWHSAFVFTRGDEVEVAMRIFQTDLAGLAVFDESRGYLLSPDTNVWEGPEDTRDSRIFNLAAAYAGFPVIAGRGKLKPLKVSSGFANGVDSIFWARNTRTGFFERAPRGVACQSGFIKTDGSVDDLTPQHRAKKTDVFPVKYDPKAPAVRWQKFLDEIFQGDKDASAKKKVLQEFLGATIFGSATRFQQHLILHGPTGANGKSVVLQAFGDLFPEGAVSSSPMQQWAENYGLWWVPNTLINLTSELPERDLLDSGPVKAVLAGEDVLVNEKYRANFRTKPRAGHVFAANTLPMTTDHTGGFFRRFILVTFNRHFEPKERDSLLIEKLLREREGIFAWAVQGFLDLERRGRYVLPESHHKALDFWKLGADSVAEFAQAHLQETEGSFDFPSYTLYEIYHAWAKALGRRPVSHTKFSRNLSRAFDKARTREGIQWAVSLTNKSRLPGDARLAVHRNKGKVILFEEAKKALEEKSLDSQAKPL